MTTEKLAKIAVSAAAYAFDRPYSYRLPEQLAGGAQPGQRVLVPFGGGNRQVEGLILKLGELSQEEQPFQLKEVSAILDEEPVLTAEGIQLALWMHDRLYCTVYEAARAMLPAGLYFALKNQCAIVEGVEKEAAYQAAGNSEALQKLLDILYANGGQMVMEDLHLAFGGHNLNRAVHLLRDRGIVTLDTSASRHVGDKTEQFASLAMSSEEAFERVEPQRKRWPVRYSVVELLSTLPSVSVKEVCYFTGASKQVLKTMEKHGILRLETQEVSRRPAMEEVQPLPPPELNQEQQTVFEGLRQLLEKSEASCSLLYGVTGSGKTQVYIRLIHEALASGKGAILMVPEIVLTAQMLRAFSAQFGDQVAVLHSMLTPGERYDEWKRVKRGEAKVVIGTRSAVFAPVQNLGMIIMDEEQENSYKSENNPRYHARDIAKFRCAKNNAMLLLGSATPSVESMFLAKSGKYHLFQMKKRYNQHALPQVIVADMKEELRSGNPRSISHRLSQEIGRNLERGEQTILFINRRGSSRMAVCMQCGNVPMCQFCSVCLTYHRDNNRLICHYCGRSIPMPCSCDLCGGSFRLEGIGTQKVEEELEELFPGTPVLRMDTDKISAVNSHDKLLDRFRTEKIPILVGTQMVAKGLDFENVTLVGVISADQSLYVDDFRASERAFSLLTQVVGRAGRGTQTGRAVIQTCTPENEVIQYACNQDYDKFYENEILLRQLRKKPPFLDCYRITISGEDDYHTRHVGYRLRDGGLSWREDPVLQRAGYQVLGPSEAPVWKVNNRYRYYVYIFCKDCPQVRKAIAHLLRAANDDKQNRGTTIFADWNPLD